MPHWPYATALDQALVGRGVPPGTVRVDLGARPDERMRIRLRWDVSRCVDSGGIRLLWDEETGWAHAYVSPGYSIPRGPVTSLRRGTRRDRRVPSALSRRRGGCWQTRRGLVSARLATSYAKLAIASKIAGQTTPGSMLPVAMAACQSAAAAQSHARGTNGQHLYVPNSCRRSR
ncbi:hypothetical protein ACH40F_09950 [Streptomyces sp. NPDC020794]|uniref:hypothetical protein n=1 Tax=unclassified Streptomyces TaxID=2593676 RepID=UPI0036EFE96F